MTHSDIHSLLSHSNLSRWCPDLFIMLNLLIVKSNTYFHIRMNMTLQDSGVSDTCCHQQQHLCAVTSSRSCIVYDAVTWSLSITIIIILKNRFIAALASEMPPTVPWLWLVQHCRRGESLWCSVEQCFMTTRRKSDIDPLGPWFMNICNMTYEACWVHREHITSTRPMTQNEITHQRPTASVATGSVRTYSHDSIL